MFVSRPIFLSVAASALIAAAIVGLPAAFKWAQPAQVETCSSPGIHLVSLPSSRIERSGLVIGVVYTTAGYGYRMGGKEVGIKVSNFGVTQWSNEPRLVAIKAKEKFCVLEETTQMVAQAQ
ncbi:MAG: hypothetical protein JWL87_367 [Candidatus Adlerbacteria bacterium]|nr:hypothetical protein [Candidatus Adlerbacteria bacterium]